RLFVFHVRTIRISCAVATLIHKEFSHMSKSLVFALLCSMTVACTAQEAAKSDPTAIIDTTAGKLRCTIFEKETPNAAANFIGLADGTKDWRSPVTHQTKHGVPLYNGTIFHRVIPDFMIQGGDPMGN